MTWFVSAFPGAVTQAHTLGGLRRQMSIPSRSGGWLSGQGGRQAALPRGLWEALSRVS